VSFLGVVCCQVGRSLVQRNGNVRVYVRLKAQLDVHVFICILYSSLFFALHVSGATCTHPQEHKLQRTAIGYVICGRQRLYIALSSVGLYFLHELVFVLIIKSLSNVYQFI
jgi:hypothetical protein